MNWQTIDNLRKKHILQGERTFKQMYAKIRRKLIAELQSAQTTADIETAVNRLIIDDEVEGAIRDTDLRVGIAFAKLTHNRYKGASNTMQTKNLPDDFWFELMQQYINRKIGIKITSVIRSEYRDIERNTLKAIQLGSENGWGADRIADEIVRLQGKMDFWKAKRIARTEVVGASNEGAMVGADNAGIELTKIWLATPHGDPRDAHLEMNGREAINGVFNINGYEMEYPGDPNAPAEEVINCRCAIGFEPKDDIIDQILNE